MEIRSHIKQDKIKWTIVTVAVIMLIAAVAFLFVKNAKNDTTKTLMFTDYSVGELDTTAGKYHANKAAIYSNGFNTASGLKVTVAEDATITYKVFYYTDAKVFVSATDALSADLSSAVPATAKYFKIVIYNGDNTEINILQIAGYAKQLTVSFNK